MLTEQGERGEIRVGLTGATTWRLLPRLTRTYRARYPLVRLELHPSVFSGAQFSDLLDGGIDVALLRAPVPALLKSRTVLDEELVAVLPAEHPLASRSSVPLADLAGENFVSYPDRQGSNLRDAVRDRLDRDGVAPRLVLLGNHGIVALGATATEVETITTMAVKAARIRSVGLGAGTLAPLGVEHARELAGRPDEAARRTLLGGSRT